MDASLRPKPDSVNPSKPLGAAPQYLFFCHGNVPVWLWLSKILRIIGGLFPISGHFMQLRLHRDVSLKEGPLTDGREELGFVCIGSQNQFVDPDGLGVPTWSVALHSEKSH
jgi:hypothetical protein